MEDVNSIIRTINEHFDIYNGEFVQTDDNGPETYEATEIYGTIKGRAVRVTVKKYSTPNVGYGIEVENLDREYDGGGIIGRGNPERDLNTTAAVFQWNGLLADLDNSPVPGV